jgi:hypothetical protein
MPLILGTNSIKDTGYNVANSCRFNDGDTASLSKTPSSNGSNTVWTVSMWCKRSHITTDQKIHAAGTSATYELLFSDADQLTLYNGSTTVFVTNRLFRDVSAWLHVVVSYNTGASGTDKCKLFINGTLETSFATDNRSSAGAMNHINQNVAQFVGNNNAGNGFDGYLAEVCVIDGTALVATSFGEFDENSPTIWKPIDVSELTFGTNGFYLDFEDSSNLGNDVNGGTDLTANNLAATDQSIDTCTNNYATLNPLHFNATIPSANTLSEGNLVFTSSQGGSAYPAMYSTMAVSQGKWYAEFKVTTGNSAIVGIGAGSLRGGFFGGGYYDYAYYYDGTFYNNGGNTGSQSSYTDGDIISVAMDLDNNKVYVAKNNTWQHSGNPSSGSGGYTITAPASQTDATGTGVYHFAYGDAGGGTPAIQGNFGSPPYSISSGNSDGNGYGNFEYAVPSGYYALNTKNLAEFG